MWLVTLVLIGHFFRVLCHLERFDKFVYIAAYHRIQVIGCKPYPVVRYPSLRPVVRSYLGASVTRANQGLSLPCNFLLVFPYLFLI